MKTIYPLLMVSGTIACLAIVIANPYYAIYPLAAIGIGMHILSCLLYTSPSPRDRTRSRMPSSA